MKLADKIRIIRKARGFSQEGLGYKLSRVNKDGISRQTVSDWENGKKMLENNVINFPNDINNYKVPRYIIRRLFYDVGKDKQNRHYAKYTNYVYLNEIGKECLIDSIDFKYAPIFSCCLLVILIYFYYNGNIMKINIYFYKLK